jgi:hypothetical protein
MSSSAIGMPISREIEEALFAGHAAVKEAAGVGKLDAVLGQRVFALSSSSHPALRRPLLFFITLRNALPPITSLKIFV